MTKYPIIYGNGELGEIKTRGETKVLLKSRVSEDNLIKIVEEQFLMVETSYDLKEWGVRVVFPVYISDNFTPKSGELLIGQRQKLIEEFIRDRAVYFASYGKRWRIK